MVTMAEVARLAGVSTMTVSNVVNNRPSVNGELRRRVLDAVSASGYVVNHAARSLRTGSTGVIGLAVPGLDRPYFGQLAARVVAKGAESGYRIAIEQTGARLEGELAAIALSRTLDCDGLIMTAVGMGPEEVKHLGRTIPLVLLGERTYGGIVDHVGMANGDGSLAATRHLIDRGCRRIVWLGGGRRGRRSDDPLGQRHDGYRMALAEAKIRPVARLEPELPGLTMPAATQAVHDLVDAGQRFDGVVAVTDTIAFGALRGLADRGLRVPDDIRLVGFDDVEEAKFSVPSLTTVAPDHDWMVDRAFSLLLGQINNTSTAVHDLIAPFRLIARESSR